MIDPLIILAALICGLCSRALGLPALLGYLAAGFVLYELSVPGGALLQALTDIGITLLLFTIGLKLQPAELLKTRVWGTTLAHMAIMQGLFMLVLFGLVPMLGFASLDLRTAAIVAFALTFSSTVFVIQIMQERGEMAAAHAQFAVGILVIQDLIAVLFLAASTGNLPEPTALLLLFLWPLSKPVLRLLAMCGHGELFTLAGMVLALGGAQLFELVGIKGDLGALIIGALLAGNQKSKELSRNLLHFKDLFLVGFFLSIGLGGHPDAEVVGLAVLVGALALVKPVFFFPLMTAMHTPPRTALLTSVALSNFSEFGLIVVTVATGAGWLEGQWVVALSLVVAVSFLVSSPLNQQSHALYRRWRDFLQRFETRTVREARPNTSGAEVIVLGMGNIGTGAYTAMADQYGDVVLGVDVNPRKLATHLEEGRRVVSADASDPDFWMRVDLSEVKLVMLALTNHNENILVGHLLQQLGYRGRLAAVIRFEEEAYELEKLGISSFNLYAQAGAGFAAHAAQGMPGDPPGAPAVAA